MNTVTILCEGAMCNEGKSASDREATIRSRYAFTMQEDALRDMRSTITKALTYTPHERVGVGRHGTLLFACAVCGHERVYGNSFFLQEQK